MIGVAAQLSGFCNAQICKVVANLAKLWLSEMQAFDAHKHLKEQVFGPDKFMKISLGFDSFSWSTFQNKSAIVLSCQCEWCWGQRTGRSELTAILQLVLKLTTPPPSMMCFVFFVFGPLFRDIFKKKNNVNIWSWTFFLKCRKGKWKCPGGVYDIFLFISGEKT